MEHLVFLDLRALTRCLSDGDVLRLALWHPAKHYDLDLPADVFALRHRADPRTRKPDKGTADV
jgi:hypothetical protein